MITFIVVALVIVGAMLGYVKFGKQVQPDNQDVVSFGNDVIVGESNGGMTEESGTEAQTYTIEITSSGFSPKTLEINKGDSVTWTNKGSSSSWPASAMHPTHNVYPESGGCIGSTFDACKGLKTGESWTFTFNEAGSWNYHDHLNTGRTGTIVVN